MNSRGLTIKDLEAKHAIEVARSFVERQAEIMDAQIERNNAGGQNCAILELPTHFSATNGVDSADMQLIIYSDLVSLYRGSIATGGKGFEKVHLDMRDMTKPKLIVRWNIGLSTDERQTRRSIIQAAQYKP